jgi:ATP-dependent DNA ligase
MRLPFDVGSIEPMLAKAAKTVPRGGHGYLYEPKWDGFRCVLYRDGAEVELGSRGGKSLSRYFPELIAAVAAAGLPERCVLDGEIVVARGQRLDFDALTERIHPADSRVRLLAEQTPASFVAFDLLAVGDESLLRTPLRQRHERLGAELAGVLPPLFVTPSTEDPELAERWFDLFEGAGLDGVMAKPMDGAYEPGKRTMVKVKHERTADVVVGGYRVHNNGGVGSLMLGVYDDSDTLTYLGVASSFTAARRQELLAELKPYEAADGASHPWLDTEDEDSVGVADAASQARRPGTLNRWNSKKDLSFVPLRPELVCEVRYEHLQAGRFRHVAHFLRWRPDRDASSCRYRQLDEAVRFDLGDVFGDALGDDDATSG